jgi:DNA polymerase-2
MRGFVLTPTYRVRNGVPEVHIYGVLETGEPCLIVDDRVRPYFFIRAADHDVAAPLLAGLRVDDPMCTTFAGEPVLRVTAALPGDVPVVRQHLESAGVVCLEADVRFAYRYLIDRGIRGAFTVHGHAEHQPRLGQVLHNPGLEPCHWTPSLRVLSLDIETDPAGQEVRSVALYNGEFSRVLVVGHAAGVSHAEPVHSERELLHRLLVYLDELDPDVLTGWNVVDFDFAVLARRARHYAIPLRVGRSDDVFDLRREQSYTRESRAITYGRVVLDGLSLVRGAFIRLEDYKLETAARTLLGRGKLIAGDDRGAEIDRLYRDDIERFVAYNLEDARLVHDILAHTGLVALAVERSLLTGMPLDRVSAAIASVDSLYLGALRARGRVAPSVGREPAPTPLTGGYVMDSIPGLYRNVLVFDFKSLYPSIIRTFNLDPLSLMRADDDEPDALTAPNGARFSRRARGILPELVEHLARERERAKAAGHAVKANAIKILMNSLYGVLGAEASRLFCPAVANAITHFGQLLIRTAAEGAAAAGYRVIYGDTDSLFVESGETSAAAALVRAEELRIAVGAAVAARIRDEFGCASHLELEFEKLYARFFMPEVRSGKSGSKKRYAGLLRAADGTERIEFVGLEAVRRDWSEVSKRFQLGLLERVFRDEPVDAFVGEFVAALRAGRFDAALAYRKAVRKDLNAYTKTTPPHVRAARKQARPPGRIISYTMTLHGPEPTGAETAPPDYAHYIEHQLRPVGDAILRFLGTDFDMLSGAPRQLALF